MVSFALDFEDLDCRRCLNARLKGLRLDAEVPFSFDFTHFGQDTFYVVSNGTKKLESYETAPMTEQHVKTGTFFGDMFESHSPLSRMMIEITSTAKDLKIKTLKLHLSITFFDAEFPDQFSRC